MILEVEFPTQRAILELVLTWNLKGAKMKMTHHVVRNKGHLHPPIAACILGYPWLTHLVQQYKHCATCVGQVLAMLPLYGKGLINGLSNHSPMSTLQMNGRRLQDIPT